METVYSLRRDLVVQSMQAASMSGSHAGLRRTHGLIDSPEWWACIEDGSLPVTTTVGEVIHFFPGHHGDWPEIEVTERGGSSSNWSCNLPATEAEKVFLLGVQIEIDHVQQELKAPFNGSTSTRVVTAIRVGT
jgi:hypothetical protein